MSGIENNNENNKILLFYLQEKLHHHQNPNFQIGIEIMMTYD